MEGRHPVAVALADLARAFPQRAIELETLRVYRRNLDDLPVGAVVDACTVLTLTSEFFPTIHAIRTTVAETSLGLPNEAEALALVEGRASLPPLVREALNMVGGYHAWRVTDQPGVMRGQFLRVYRELRDVRIREAVVGEALPPAPPVRELTA
jgi:hypothetical protein